MALVNASYTQVILCSSLLNERHGGQESVANVGGKLCLRFLLVLAAGRYNAGCSGHHHRFAGSELERQQCTPMIASTACRVVAIAKRSSVVLPTACRLVAMVKLRLSLTS